MGEAIPCGALAEQNPWGYKSGHLCPVALMEARPQPEGWAEPGAGAGAGNESPLTPPCARRLHYRLLGLCPGSEPSLAPCQRRQRQEGVQGGEQLQAASPAPFLEGCAAGLCSWIVLLDVLDHPRSVLPPSPAP